MRVAVIVGTRPEGVKLAPIVSALDADADLEPVLVTTGQHREMLDQTLAFFGLTADHRLDVMRDRQSLNGLTERLVAGLDRALATIAPDAVVVQGDTTSTLCGGLAAFQRGIPVVHVEAGLRTGDRHSPFPEEANRRMVTCLASVHLAPTQVTADNLLAESVPPDEVIVTGNTVIDALLWATGRPYTPTLEALAPFSAPASERGPLVLVTAHRRESHGEPMTRIAAAVAELAERRPDVNFLMPLHRNPVVRETVAPAVGELDNVTTTEPLDYADFTWALSRSHLALTDSGGVQEEAPALGVPVLVMRDVTERPEAVDVGAALLVGTDRAAIVDAVTDLLDTPDRHMAMATAGSPYGDGRAAERSVEAIRRLLGLASDGLAARSGLDLTRTPARAAS